MPASPTDNQRRWRRWERAASAVRPLSLAGVLAGLLGLFLIFVPREPAEEPLLDLSHLESFFAALFVVSFVSRLASELVLGEADVQLNHPRLGLHAGSTKAFLEAERINFRQVDGVPFRCTLTDQRAQDIGLVLEEGLGWIRRLVGVFGGSALNRLVKGSDVGIFDSSGGRILTVRTKRGMGLSANVHAGGGALVGRILTTALGTDRYRVEDPGGHVLGQIEPEVLSRSSTSKGGEKRTQSHRSILDEADEQVGKLWKGWPDAGFGDSSRIGPWSLQIWAAVSPSFKLTCVGAATRIYSLRDWRDSSD